MYDDAFSESARIKIEGSKEYKLTVDKNGQLKFPDEIKLMMGLKENAEIRVMVNHNKVVLFPSIHSLTKLYIEPTTLCNLSCRTCVRNTWSEKLGQMSRETFDKLIEQARGFEALQSVMFGGFGEPTFHKDILYMINRVKSLGVKAEMVSNGTLLDQAMINGLFKNKLDTLWVSFDGTETDTFNRIRKGAEYKSIVDNLITIKHMNEKNQHKISVGITFVAMKNNINNLDKLDDLARIVGASMIAVSNVIPYTKDMIGQMVCDWSARNSLDQIAISLPDIDINENTKEPLFNLLRKNNNVTIMGRQIDTEISKCKFIRERSMFVRWDGRVSPCMGLLHTNKTYPFNSPNTFEREVKEYTLGNLNETSLKRIWDSEEYQAFREKVDTFDFSPCLKCGPCQFAENNEEDCFGNTFPTCGGCLWGQGVIQCP